MCVLDYSALMVIVSSVCERVPAHNFVILPVRYELVTKPSPPPSSLALFHSVSILCYKSLRFRILFFRWSQCDNKFQYKFPYWIHVRHIDFTRSPSPSHTSLSLALNRVSERARTHTLLCRRLHFYLSLGFCFRCRIYIFFLSNVFGWRVECVPSGDTKWINWHVGRVWVRTALSNRTQFWELIYWVCFVSSMRAMRWCLMAEWLVNGVAMNIEFD